MRKIKALVKGSSAVDGAGVRLVRVLGSKNTTEFDPFLMLDSFDSANPDDYIKGFPMHPHRGIETVTYLIEGKIDHRDSLGNSGSILDGEVQWMTAGSGIMHEEMPQPAPRMLGLQLWLNLPKKDKMTAPAYFAITKDMVNTLESDNYIVKVISGEFKNTKGAAAPNVQMRMLDVSLKNGGSIRIDTKSENCVFIFSILGDITVGKTKVSEKTAVLFTKGEYIEVSAEKDATFIYFEAPPLREPIAWGGPIVMNTREELNQAFEDLRNNTFIK